MPVLTCTKPLDACGRETLHPDCFKETEDVGLGPGKKQVIQTKWVGEVDTTRPLPEVWLFVESFQPVKLAEFTDGATYTLNWDFRRSLVNGKVRFGLHFTPTETEKAQGFKSYWIFSNDAQAAVEFSETCTTITFTDAYGQGDFNPFQELMEAGDPDVQCWATMRQFGIAIYECCPVDCTKPYDNTVFCHATHDETAFSVRAMSNPGLAKQVFIAQGGNVVPLRGIALTRSADAFDKDLKLVYGTQQWVMVWDLELNRLVDFFPKEWLRYGAAMYYQQVTLRKDINVGKSSRKPYYIEVVDLGLVNNPQGSFDLDRDVFGQRTTNWDVPSRLMELHYAKQQLPAPAYGVPVPMDQQLNAEFNQLSVDRFHSTLDQAVLANRQRFFEDRKVFLDQTARQRFHDQIMFLHREVAEKTLRAMTDSVEQMKNLVDSFNPEATDGFGYYLLVILNLISNKLLRTSKDLTGGVFGDAKLDPNEETSGDWMRYIYGEIRRLVEINKIEKKDVQAELFKALANIDPTDPNAAINALKNAVNVQAVQEQYELASSGAIPAGAGLVDPDTLEENRKRGIAK